MGAAVGAGAAKAGASLSGLASGASFVASLFSLFAGFSESSKRRKREKRQGKLINLQFAEVLGRVPGIKGFFAGLEELTEAGFDVREEEIGRKAMEESFQLGRAGEEAQEISGLQRAGTALSEIDRQKQLSREGFFGEIEGLRLAEEGELLGIGRQEELELQDIQDILFQLETEQLARGTGGFKTPDIEDFDKYLSEIYG